MNKVTRMLAMTGMALAATATMAMGAASAAQAAPAKKAVSASASDHHFGNRTRVIGYYRNAFICHRVGSIGERRDRWDDYDCYRVRVGFHRGAWVLVAKWDRRGWDHNGLGNWNNNRPGNWNNNGWNRKG